MTIIYSLIFEASHIDTLLFLTLAHTKHFKRKFQSIVDSKVDERV